MCRLIFIFFCFCPVTLLVAQPNLKLWAEKPTGQDSFSVHYDTRSPYDALVRFHPGKFREAAGFPDWLLATLNSRTEVDGFRLKGNSNARGTKQYLYFRQTYKGIDVDLSSLNAMVIGNQVESFQLYQFPIPDSVPAVPRIGLTDALVTSRQHLAQALAISTSEVSVYADTAYATLVVYPMQPADNIYRLAYRISAVTPGVDGLYLLYVDALTSAVFHKVQYKSYFGCFGKGSEAGGSHAQPSEISLGRTASGSETPAAGSSATIATGRTRFSGVQSGVATESSGSQFRLRAIDYINNFFSFSPDIITKDYRNMLLGTTDDANNISAAADIVDADNDWLEYTDNSDDHKNPVLSGFEVHFNSQLILDYWYNVHERNSWDNAGGDLKGYVNTRIIVDGEVDPENAGWSPKFKSMFYGNGLAPDSANGVIGNSPFVSLDITGHEIGHGVSSKRINQGNGFTPLAVNQPPREADAIDEGLSDIWAVCADRYYNLVHFDQPPKSPWSVSDEIFFYETPGTCRNFVRFIPDPRQDCRPRVWMDNFWDNNNEPHHNSTVLSYWFYLIAQGGSGYCETNRYNYNLSPIGFEKAERFVYELCPLLPGDVDYIRFRNRAVELAESLVGSDLDHYLTDEDMQRIRMAFAAVGLGMPILYHDMTNAPFETNEIKNIAVSKGGQVWAGTLAKGVYRYDGETWLRSPTSVSGYEVTDIKADPIGNIWITQRGRGENNFYAGGGVYKFPENSFSGFTYYNANDGITSRHPSGLFIKSDVTNNSLVGKVYISQRFKPAFPDAAEPETVAGKVSYLNAAGAFDNFIWDGASTLVTGYSCVGGNPSEVWAFNTSEQKIVRLKHDNTLLGVLGRDDIPGIPFIMGFFINAIHFDAAGRKWLGFADSLNNSGGVMVQDVDGNWKALPTSVLPFPCTVRDNAITSDAQGNVWIGTGQGLVRFFGNDPGNESGYTRYTVSEGLPSIKVNAIAADEVRGGVWIATNNGICFLYAGGSERISQVSSEVVGLCSDRLRISFSATGPFLSQPSANQFIVEMANRDGSFAVNPIRLGVFTNNTVFQGTQNFSNVFQLPFGYELPFGTTLIRIRSTNPPFSYTTYISNPENTLPSAPTAPGGLNANLECVRDEWTHYYHEPDNPSVIDGDEVLLLSIRKNGNTLGSIGMNMTVSVGTTNMAGTNSTSSINSGIFLRPFLPMNRYWDVTVDDANQPTSPVLIRFYYSNTDLSDVNGTATDKLVRHEDLVFYKTIGTTCSPNPATNFSGCTSIIPLTYEVPGGPPFTDGLTWRHLDMGKNIHAAEYYVSGFSGGGGGHTVGGGVFTNSYVQSVKNGNWSDSTTWSTGMVPDRKSQVTISHSVQVDVPTAECLMLNVKPAGNVVVQGGAALKTFAQ